MSEHADATVKDSIGKTALDYAFGKSKDILTMKADTIPEILPRIPIDEHGNGLSDNIDNVYVICHTVTLLCFSLICFLFLSGPEHPK